MFAALLGASRVAGATGAMRAAGATRAAGAARGASGLSGSQFRQEAWSQLNSNMAQNRSQGKPVGEGYGPWINNG